MIIIVLCINIGFAIFTNVQKFKIYRLDNVLYYSLNDCPMILFQDLSDMTLRFDTAVTFGASTKPNGEPYRFFKGTLKNMYIKLEDL